MLTAIVKPYMVTSLIEMRATRSIPDKAAYYFHGSSPASRIVIAFTYTNLQYKGIQNDDYKMNSANTENVWWRQTFLYLQDSLVVCAFTPV